MTCSFVVISCSVVVDRDFYIWYLLLLSPKNKDTCYYDVRIYFCFILWRIWLTILCFSSSSNDNLYNIVLYCSFVSFSNFSSNLAYFLKLPRMAYKRYIWRIPNASILIYTQLFLIKWGPISVQACNILTYHFNVEEYWFTSASLICLWDNSRN